MKEEILARISECGVPRDKIGLEFQENESLGHYSTSAAFLVARQKNISSKAAAEELAALIEKNNDGFFSRIEVAGAGFINFWISPAVFQKETLTILNKGEAYGKNDAGKGRKARVEYVSANPTGRANRKTRRHAFLLV
ncbi:MAG: Arginine-tRNA ligase [Candidatus Jorgensenbacteria bacterium GW2011_GWA2_45_9]|uniref:Arginine-tRNA ligase n=1 Tax=Candidatus Jorgensenbacteria bacterium GW2011_GWA2_45_9 TaxID=1618663 RepID=A0A0G1N1X3_9BACT|nr:MAG: Arginine-tRNA ligase [Candidatus Jorgensenbacteria bacterium GW2011_GWA2_45_9]